MPPDYRAKAWVDSLTEVNLSAGVINLVLNIPGQPYYFARLNSQAQNVDIRRLDDGHVWIIRQDGVIDTVSPPFFNTIKTLLNLPEGWIVSAYNAVEPGTANIHYKLSPQE